MSGARTSRVAATTLVLSLAGCSGARYDASNQGPALTMPAHFAEGSGHGEPEAEPVAPPPADGGVEAAAVVLVPPPKGAQPDPEALREARQFEYVVAYDRGKLRIKSVRAVRFPKPVVTSRRMGRFAIELWIGHELVERVRFDFPLVAAEDIRRSRRRPLEEMPSFAPGVEATETVLVPASTRATRAVLVDRATGHGDELPWPPDAPLGPSRTDRPSPAAGADAGTGADASPSGIADAGPG